MATKTKTKLTKALKDTFINELKDKKETDRLERVKANSKLKEVIVYTQSTCPFCKQLKEQMDTEGIKYTEKEWTEYPEEWARVSETTQLGVFPTVEIDGEFLVPRRDFQQVPQGIQRIIAMANPERLSSSNETKLLEQFKTLNYNMSNAFQQLGKTLQPLQTFVQNIQKELEEEEKAEKETQEKK
jgi:glutaredoxin